MKKLDCANCKSKNDCEDYSAKNSDLKIQQESEQISRKQIPDIVYEIATGLVVLIVTLIYFAILLFFRKFVDNKIVSSIIMTAIIMISPKILVFATDKSQEFLNYLERKQNNQNKKYK